MPELIGHIVEERSNSVTYEYLGDQVVAGLGDIAIDGPGQPHYTDTREQYEKTLGGGGLSQFLQSHEIRIRHPDKREEVLLSFDEIEPFCNLVNDEYAATVTPLLRKITGNQEHQVPTLDPRLVYASYVSLRVGGAVVLPTSVGNIVGAASPRGLSTMYAVKERPAQKAGVVLTTMDQITDLAEVPEGWDGYLRHMHHKGILTGSKLPRNDDHPLFKNQPEWSRDNSSQSDGTSMFVFLPGPYSDVTARILASENLLLTASSANKSGEGNNRDIAKLHPDIKQGCDFVAWDPQAVNAYMLDEANESQGVMVDFLPDEERNPKLHVIRLGFMNGPFFTQTRAYLAAHPELGVEQPTFSVHNVAYKSNNVVSRAA